MSQIGTLTTPAACVIEEQEIMGVARQFASGIVEGYQWRLRVTYPATEDSPCRTAWTPWVFGSIESIETMLLQWQTYLATGHRAQAAPPGSPTH